MKIAIYTDIFYPELSGITDSLVLLGDTLAGRGHKILFVAPGYTRKNYDSSNVPVGERKSSENISVKRMLSFKYSGYPTSQGRVSVPSFGTHYAVKKFGPDVIFSNSPFGAGIQALLDASLLGVPLVGTNHTPPGEFMAYSFINARWFARIINYYFAWYYNRAIFMSAPCQSLINEMMTFGFKKNHKVVANPTNLNLFSPVSGQAEKEALKKQFNLSPRSVLYTGRLAEEKHVDVIIRAVAEVRKVMPEATLAITGHGAAEEKLKKLAAELNMEKSTFFLGYVDEKTYPLLYKASDIFVIMSTAESQSLSLMQAMATGLPVIGANARALPEYIPPESGFIVPVGDFEALAKTLINIFSDEELRARLSAGSIEQVSHFSTDIIAAEWEKIFSEALVKSR